MTQQLTALNLKSLLRLETVLLVLALAGAGAWVYLHQQAATTKEQGIAVDKRVVAARQQLKNLTAGSTQDDIKKEVQRIQSLPPAGALPSRQDVFGLSTALTSFAVGHQLQLTTVDVVTIPISPTGTQTTALGYSIKAQGNSEALVGALGVVDSYPSALVKKLELVRGPGDQWIMTLNLTLPYV